MNINLNKLQARVLEFLIWAFLFAGAGVFLYVGFHYIAHYW